MTFRESALITHRIVRLLRAEAGYDACVNCVIQTKPELHLKAPKIVVNVLKAFAKNNGILPPSYISMEITMYDVRKVLWVFDVYSGKYEEVAFLSADFLQAHFIGWITMQTYEWCIMGQHRFLFRKQTWIVSDKIRNVSLADFYTASPVMSVAEILN